MAGHEKRDSKGKPSGAPLQADAAPGTEEDDPIGLHTEDGTSDMPASLPLRVSKYTAIAQLGEGGMARVYLAVVRGPRGFSKMVVLKMLREEDGIDDSVDQMLYREATVAAQLSHPNVVQTYEVFEHQGRPVMVMEYLEGKSLSALRGAAQKLGSRIPIEISLAVLRDALRGLDYAHNARDYEGNLLGLIHRDISPQNIFVTYDGVVKVLDFGIAKTSQASTQTFTGALKGKVRYMAPEQILGEELDRRADIFSSGVVLWEETTGQRIWEGKSDGYVLHRVVETGLPEIGPLAPDVPPELAEIVRKACAPDPADRYATAAELSAALDEVLVKLGKAPSAQELGAYVSRLFKKARARFRVRVEEVIAAANTTGDVSDDLAPLHFSSRLSSIGDGTDHSVGGARSTTESHPRRFSLGLLLGVALVAVIGIGLVGLGWFGQKPIPEDRSTTPKTPADGSSSQTAPVTSVPSPPTSEVPIPPPLPQPSASVPPPRSSALSGPIPTSTRIRVSPPPLASPQAGIAPPPQSGPTSETSPPAPAPDPCRNPFTVEIDGLRRVRPECIH